MRTLFLGAALAALAQAAHAGAALQEQTPGAPWVGIATQPKIYVPGAGLLGYVPPVPNGVIAALGDSYIGNGGGAAWISGTYTTYFGSGASYMGDLLALAGNRTLSEASWGYGVGSQSSLGVAYRMTSVRRDTGQANSTSSTISGNTLTVGGTVTSGFGLNEVLTGAGVSGQNVVITGYGTGTGGGGTYTISNPNGVSIGTGETIGVTQNPAYAQNADFGADEMWNQNGTGQYSVLTDPANIVFLNNATNDVAASMPVSISIANVAEELDALGPNGTMINGVAVAGANKLVVIGSAHPRGVAISKDEVHAIGASVTPSYTPNSGSGTWSSDTCNGAINMPVVVANYSGGAVVNGVNTVFTKAGTAASQPASQGTYNVTSAGVYWFNAADVALGVKVALTYCFIDSYQQTGTALTEILDLHNWLISNASDYVANCTNCSGTDYHTPGALYSRPWVVSADTWSAMLDPATGVSGTQTYLNLPGTSYEGLHNDSYGSFLNATVEAAALAHWVPSTTPAFAYPVYQNQYIQKASGAALTYSGTLPGVMATQIGAIHTAFPSGGQFEICYLTACGVDNGSGSLVSNGINVTTVHGTGTFSTGTINYTTGAWSITFSDDPPVNGHIIAYGDPIETVGGVQIKTGNLIVNGQMDYANIAANSSGGTLTTITSANCNAANLGLSNSNYVPQGWTLSGVAADQTALAAGTMKLTCGYGTAPDGNPGFYVTVVGLSPTSSNITLAQNVTNPASFINPAIPDITRGNMRLSYTVGPSGHLYGVRPPNLKVSNTVGTASSMFGTPCPTTACTIIVGLANSYNNTVGLTNLDLQQYSGTADSRDLLTPPASSNNDAATNTISTSGVSVGISANANTEPVDYTVWFENAAERITPK